MYESPANIAWLLVDRHVKAGLGSKPALVEVAGDRLQSVSYSELQSRIVRIHGALDEVAEIKGRRLRVAVFGSATADFVAAWISSVTGGHEVILCPPHYDLSMLQTASRWRPDLVLADHHQSGAVLIRTFVSRYPARCGASEGGRFGLLTSGSTGAPRVCLHSATAVRAFEAAVTRELWRLSPSDRVLSASPAHFSFGLQGIHGPLAIGATAVLCPFRKRHRDLLEVIRRADVTVMLGVPSLYHILMHGARGEMSRCPLRLSLSAGEKLPALIRRNWETFSGALMLDSIGTTETFLPYLSEDVRWTRRGLQPVGGMRYRRLPLDRPSQRHGLFEIAVSSRSTMDAYLGDHNLPRSASPWFHTGDLFREEGAGLRFVSRRTERIKVKGLWTSPQRFEEHLLELPEIREAAVVSFANAQGLTRLHAVIVPADSCKLPHSEIIERLKKGIDRGPFQQVTRFDHVSVMTELPRTASGKILRRALRQQATRENKTQGFTGTQSTSGTRRQPSP